jgi:hypothetical protein
MEPSTNSLVWGAKVLALFILLGGVVGGATTALVLFVWTLVSAAWESIPSFLMFLPLASMLGIAFGLPASIATGLVYAIIPQARRPWPVAAVGTAVSAVVGFALPFVLSRYATLDQSLYFMGLYAASGCAAALACHAHISRWRLA